MPDTVIPLDHEDEPDTDTYSPAPLTHPAGATMTGLLESLRNKGFRVSRPYNEPSRWSVCCPYHPDLGPAILAQTVQLEQRPGDVVWVHAPQGYRACSCTVSQVIAAFAITDPRVVPAGTIVTEDMLRELVARSVRDTYGAIVWDDSNQPPADWLDEPFIERGQFTSIYGPAGIGKSLLTQDRAAQLANRGTRVLYLDAENPVSEVRARLHAMGHHPTSLTSLTYMSFPNLPALDTPAGAAKLTTMVDALDPQLVILDTWSKFLSGDEAAPSTHTAAYNLSIVPLRRQGIAVQAIDHAGKDPARGPRGGSSKVDNVDALWLVTAKTGGRLRLERRKSRTGRGPDLIELVRREHPLRHERVDLAAAAVLTPDVRECVAKLDELEVPTGWGRERAAGALRANAFPVRNETLGAALKVRRERGTATVDSLDLSPRSGDRWGQVSDQDPGTGRGQVAK